MLCKPLGSVMLLASCSAALRFVCTREASAKDDALQATRQRHVRTGLLEAVPNSDTQQAFLQHRVLHALVEASASGDALEAARQRHVRHVA